MSFRHDPKEPLDALDWLHMILTFGPFVFVLVLALIEGRG